MCFASRALRHDPGRGRRARPGDLVLIGPASITRPSKSETSMDESSCAEWIATASCSTARTKSPTGSRPRRRRRGREPDRPPIPRQRRGVVAVGAVRRRPAAPGMRGSYITAYDNGLYGVYAFGAEHGRFDHIYASGHPDSGVYVGHCNPCHARVLYLVAEHNQVGYEATNASGDISVSDNVWRNNRVGGPDQLAAEGTQLPPARVTAVPQPDRQRRPWALARNGGVRGWDRRQRRRRQRRYG